jgi:L-lactate dehydrogenase complex protein LldG
MSARDAILNRVRAAARTGRVPAVDHGSATDSARRSDDRNAKAFDDRNAKAFDDRSAKAFDDRSAKASAERQLDREALVGHFCREARALGVDCHVEATCDAVRARVAELSKDEAVFSWDADRLPYDVGAVLSSPTTGADTRARQSAAALGVTGCHAAIAETGSLVVLSGPGTPRAASLLPPAHLCLVRRGDVYASMGEFFSARAADIAAASCCTFITGPSRTADIELTLTLGVHGPGKVIVVVGP